MIKLFITDIDGCLSIPFETPDWDLLSQVRRLNQQSSHDMAVPSLTVCSGRPMSYVEAVVQWLGIENPAVFESAGIYDLSTNRVRFLSAFDAQAEKEVKMLKKWLQDEIIPQDDGLFLEFTKKMDAGIVHSRKEVIDDVYPRILEYVEEHHHRFEVHKTDVSVNIILSDNNKKNGIEKLCELMDIQPDEVAYIGDSSGDIPGLQVVDRAFAPLNASRAVKQESEVLDAENTKAVLMAYRSIIEDNREILAAAG